MVRRTHLLLFLLALVTADVLAQMSWTPAEMIHYKRVSSPVISDDGRLVAYVVASPRLDGDQSDFLSHIHLVSADGTGNRQLTSGAVSCTNPRFSPNGQCLSFTSRKDGKNQLFLLRLSGGEPWPVTAQKESVNDYRWAPDGKRIAFTMIEPRTEAEEKDHRERRDWEVVDEFRNAHLYTVGLTKDKAGNYPIKRLTRGAFHVSSFNWSPDSRTIAFAHMPAHSENDYLKTDISTVPADSGVTKALITSENGDDTPHYSPDGRFVAYTVSSVARPSWMNQGSVHVVPATGGESRPLPLTPDENPTLLGWAADGRSVVVEESMHTRKGLYRLSLDGNPPAQLPVPDRGFTLGYFLNRTDGLAYLYQSTELPTEVYAARLDEPVGRKLTDVHADYAKGKTLARTELINWPAGDRKFTIEGLLTYPANYQPGRQYPLMLYIHGGPELAFGQVYTGANTSISTALPYPLQALSQQGYFVLWPNPRGSTGYGADFRRANYRDWATGPYTDLMGGVDHVIGQGLAHPDSLVVSGWSYGGYMTAVIITKTTRFKAAMAGAACTNLMSYMGTADIPDFVPDYMGKEFWEDPKIYAEQSPMFSIKNARTPTLVLHGLADERVPPEQGFQLHRALQRLGVPTQMVTYPRQSHVFTEPKFIQDAGERMIAWFNRYLGRKQTPNR